MEVRMRRFVIVAAALPFAACNPDFAGFQDQVETQILFQEPTDQLDILWVIDNSNSMQVEQSLLSRGFSSFAGSLEESNTNFHLGVITTEFIYTDPARGQLIGDPAVITRDDDYVTLFGERALVGLNGSGKEKGLEAALHALSTEMATGPNRGFLRPEAKLLVVFVSDEDDCSDEGALGDSDNTACYSDRDALVPVEEYSARFRALKANASDVQIGAIVGPENSGGGGGENVSAQCDTNTFAGTRYIQLVEQLTGPNGIGSICEADWGNFLGDLSLEATGIRTTFLMNYGAKDGTLTVTVDGNVVPESGYEGYTYDAENRSITFHGVWIPPRGAEIVIEYTIEPGTAREDL
jgi:hypothetical protein